MARSCLFLPTPPAEAQLLARSEDSYSGFAILWFFLPYKTFPLTPTGRRPSHESRWGTGTRGLRAVSDESMLCCLLEFSLRCYDCTHSL